MVRTLTKEEHRPPCGNCCRQFHTLLPVALSAIVALEAMHVICAIKIRDQPGHQLCSLRIYHCVTISTIRHWHHRTIPYENKGYKAMEMLYNIITQPDQPSIPMYNWYWKVSWWKMEF